MNESIKIALLHIMLLGSQAIYMYITSKDQMKKRKVLYLAAIPFVAGFAVLLYRSDPKTYSLYEYSLVFCMIAAAIADSVCAAYLDRDYMQDSSIRRFCYTYFMIGIAAVCLGHVNILTVLAPAVVLACTFAVMVFVKDHPAKELLKALPLTVISVASAWILLHTALK